VVSIGFGDTFTVVDTDDDDDDEVVDVDDVVDVDADVFVVAMEAVELGDIGLSFHTRVAAGATVYASAAF